MSTQQQSSGAAGWFALVGFVLVILGAFWACSADDVSCGGRPIGYGDTCVTYTNGHESGRETLGQRQERNRNKEENAPWAIGGGLALIGLSVVLGAVAARRR